MEILRAEKINKSFGEGEKTRSIIKDLSLTIDKGEFISIMGPSGSGKSTLLYALSTLDAPDSGSLIFNGKDISSLNEDELAAIRRESMGFVFQDSVFLETLSILDNIILPTVASKGDSKRQEIVERATGYMKEAGIEDLKDRSIHQVSGGQLQRSGIVRALINEPEIIFADEPTGALNSRSSEEIMDLLSDLNRKGQTLVLVTHDAKVASRSGRVIFLKDGDVLKDMDFIRDGVTDEESRFRSVRTTMDKLGI